MTGEKVKQYLPVDIETSSLDFNRGRILGIGYGEIYNEIRLIYGDINSPVSASIPPLSATAQNGRFEYKWLKKAGVPFYWEFDTLLAASILIDRPEDLDLGSLARHYLGAKDWKDDTNKLFKKKNWVELLEADPELQKALRERNLYDLKYTKDLTVVLQKKLESEGMTEFFHSKIMPAARMLAETEYRGMRIDLPAVKAKLATIEQQLVQLKLKLDSWAQIEINWNSPKQLADFLRKRGYNLWIYDFKKRTTVESTGSDALKRLLPNENIKMLLDYRGTIKLKGFLEGWLEEQYEGRLYPSYNIANTRTGRLSCSNPNLQQVPRDPSIRSLFIPSESRVFVIADYAQIEPRVAAHYTGDEALLQVFEEKLDLYGSLAVKVLGAPCHPNEVKTSRPDLRRLAKEIGLSVLYGIGAAKLATIIQQRAGIVFTKEQAADIIKDYFKAYPKLLAFRKYVEKKVLAGELLQTHYGRKFKINPDKVFSTGTNTVIQSTASDACLFSQLEVDKKLAELGIDAPLVAIVHDEVIREAKPEEAEQVGKIMEDIMCNQGFNVPLKLDWVIGQSWGDKN